MEVEYALKKLVNGIENYVDVNTNDLIELGHVFIHKQDFQKAIEYYLHQGLIAKYKKIKQKLNETGRKLRLYRRKSLDILSNNTDNDDDDDDDKSNNIEDKNQLSMLHKLEEYNVEIKQHLNDLKYMINNVKN